MTDLRPVHGWIPPKRWPTPAEIGAHQIRMAAASAIESFTPTTLGTPTILDQLGSAACFGFAAAQAIHIARQAVGAASVIPSPVVPYWFARREAVALDSYVKDDGSDPDSMIKALEDFGACPWGSEPFDEAKVNDRPNDVALLAAQSILCKLSPILATGAALWTAIQHAIQYERLPVIVALEVIPSFDRPATGGIVDDTGGESRGLHAQCVPGFTAQGALDAGSRLAPTST